MAHEVFISHSSKDKRVADLVCSKLEARGVQCWIAPRDVQSGVKYAGQITAAVKASKVVVLVFSAHSNASSAVANEVELAFSTGKAILPFRIEDTPLSDDLEFYIKSVHWLDATTKPLRPHLKKLSDEVPKLLSQNAEAVAAKGFSDKPAINSSKRRFLKKAVVAPAVIVALIAAFPFWFPRHDDKKAVAAGVLRPGNGATPIEYKSSPDNSGILGRAKRLVQENDDARNPNKIPESAVMIFLGDSWAWTPDFPITVIAQKHEDMLVLEKDESGGVLISGKFFDASGKIVCELVKNVIHLNAGHFFRVEQTPHRLVVYNDEAKAVCDVDFINRRAIRITGDFYLRDGVHVVIAPDHISIPNRTFSNSFFYLRGGKKRIIFDL